jgi:aldose 1-epimerase
MAGEHILRSGSARVVVDAGDGGRITSLEVAGVELLGGVGEEVLEHGSFVMAPWAGRIRDGRLHVDGVEHRLPTVRTHPHAGHGLVVDRPWDVESSSAGRVVLRADLDGRWPWSGHVRQEIRLAGDRLEQRVEVHSAGGRFPATVGWHPWFRREIDGVPAEYPIPARGMLRRDTAGIPDGTVVAVPPGPWDDCFTGVAWPVVVRWPGVRTLMIRADVDFVVVYDQRSPAFCIEPQSGPPDGPNTVPWLVGPDEPLVATTVWAWA